MNPMVLCYNLRTEKLAKLRVLALRLGIRLRTVMPEEFALPVGALAGVSEPPAELPAVEPFDDEMIVMAHFRRGMLDAFINGMRQSRVPPIPLKAMLTETNAGWNAVQLHDTILEEHRQMEAMRKK